MKYRFMRYPGFLAKAFTVSYDDGKNQDRRLIEILRKNGIKGTFNIGGWVFNGREGHIPFDEIKSLYDGFELAIHGTQHKALVNCTAVEGIDEVLSCRKTLEKTLGKIVRGFAYPDRSLLSSAKYPEIEAYLQMLGILYARCGGGTEKFALPENLLQWHPTAKHDSPALFDLCERFFAENPDEKYIASRDPLLFFVWGHSYECDGMWDKIEDFYAKIGGRADIWYASCEELVLYKKAYESLVSSADGSIIYNPTLYDIFFVCDGKKIKLAPGETVIL